MSNRAESGDRPAPADASGAGADGRTIRRPGGSPAGTHPPVNPEASPLVALYRRVVPLRARRAVAGRVSPQLRGSVKRTLADTARAVPDRMAEVRAERARRVRPELFSAPERRMVQVNRQPKAATVREFPTPLAARDEALRMVCEALGEAGVDYFCVRGVDPAGSVVAVPANERMRAARALARLCSRTAGYVGVRTRRRRRGPRHTVPGDSQAARRLWTSAPLVRMCWYTTDRRGTTAIGQRYGCTVEFWETDERGMLVAPRRNRCTEEISPDTPRVTVPLARLDQLHPVPHAPADAERGADVGTGTRAVPARKGAAAHPVVTIPEFSRPLPDDVPFPVDAVYTWVDGADPDWLARRALHAGETYHAEAANAARYLSRDELRYSLRSLHQYAPWIRHVYLVTDRQVPSWLNTDHPGLTVVDHREIFSDTSLLPTFNSHAIESQLHHIEGLAEHFLYLNDDVFFGRLTVPQHFFLGNGLTRFFLSKAHIPYGLPTPEDVPVSVAGKNNRMLLEERFGAVITQKMKHVPHALRRSVLYEIEKEFADRHTATAANRFRDLNDLSVTSSLHHYYAFLTGRAVPGGIPYDYFDMAHPAIETRLGRLLAAHNRTVFCLNDTVSDEKDLATQLSIMEPFLQAYFPFASPYERDA
ncbi:stealth family protein [Streptomyces calidiresistens]|uniref:stealth family protein n=1 Tax=Streptomyces calidiresistens TaxID=1485586 RepID=UPI002B1FC371|nr:stealth family protein [Streptomyces calidiresistens]